MAKQAKVLSESELKRLLAIIAQRKHAARDRAAVMLSFYAGLRVGEIAALTAVLAYFRCRSPSTSRVID